MPKSSIPALLETSVRSFEPFAAQRSDQIFGNAAQAETTEQNRRAIFEYLRWPHPRWQLAYPLPLLRVHPPIVAQFTAQRSES